MKEGWEYKKLGEVCNIDFGTRVVRSRDAGSIYPVYGGGGATFKMDMYNREDCMVISRFGMSEQCTRFVKGKFFLNDSGLTLSMKENCMIQEFMDWQILYLNNTIYSLGRGAAQKNLDTKALADVRITYPHNLSEQQSIVDYLDAAFAKIDAMKANAEKRLNEAKALFQASLKDMLEPKEGWEEKKLGDICSDIRYGTSTPSNENGEYKYLRMNNITNDGFLDVSHYKTISLPEKELEKCLVKRGDIIFNRTNSRELVGKSCVFTEDENMVIAGYLIRIRLKEGFEPQFITYSMNLQRSLGLFQHLIVGAVHQANISANNIQKVIINYPPLSEQKSIVATLDSLKSKVDKLQANYEKISQECDALKQAILRQVFE
jgi:type I restriction enzyme S subunit